MKLTSSKADLDKLLEGLDEHSKVVVLAIADVVRGMSVLQHHIEPESNEPMVDAFINIMREIAETHPEIEVQSGFEGGHHHVSEEDEDGHVHGNPDGMDFKV